MPPTPAPLSCQTMPPSTSESSASGAEVGLKVSVLLLTLNAPGLLPVMVLALL